MNIWLFTGYVVHLKGLRNHKEHHKENPIIWEACSYWWEGRLADFRLTSPTIKEEYDCWFLRTYEFGFVCPLAYHGFMNQLTIQQRSWIRRLRFEIMSREPDHEYLRLSDTGVDEGWMGVCGELPTTLVSITLEIGRYCRLELPGTYYNGSWSFC